MLECSAHGDRFSVLLHIAYILTFGIAATPDPCPVATPPALSPAFVHGQLSVSGTLIVDKNSAPVLLRGMSFFWSQWSSKFWNADVVNWLVSDWKCTLLRLPMGVATKYPDGYLNKPNDNMQLVNTVVSAAVANGIYVIIDWHYHDAHDHPAEAKTFFSAMAKKWGACPNVLFELWNEPIFSGSCEGQTGDACAFIQARDAGSWDNIIKPFHENLLPEVRQYTQNIAIIGTRMWDQLIGVGSNPLTSMDAITGHTNVVYALHFYSYTHKQTIRLQAQQVLDNGLPIMVTEWGTCEANGGQVCPDGASSPETCYASGLWDEQETLTWLTWLKTNKIWDANWAVNDKDETCSALKPGSSATGGWQVSDLTASGVFVRNQLILDNSNYFKLHNTTTTTSGTTTSGTTFEKDCPSSIVVRGAASIQAKRMGKYTKLTDSAQGHVLYKNDQDQFLYYYTAGWQIGPDYTRSNAALKGGDGKCPTYPFQWKVATHMGWSTTYPVQVFDELDPPAPLPDPFQEEELTTQACMLGPSMISFFVMAVFIFFSWP